MPGRCECGEVTDWMEVGSTWICRKCSEKEIRKSMNDLRTAFRKMSAAERSLSSLFVDTLTLPALLDNVEKEIKKIKAA
ncbi:MAG: hypothetical protein P8013_11745 [Candidatus Sulfobium sp.]|jgi:hypothetical protein